MNEIYRLEASSPLKEAVGDVQSAAMKQLSQALLQTYQAGLDKAVSLITDVDLPDEYWNNSRVQFHLEAIRTAIINERDKK
jgi:hypothetical protein